MINRGMPRRDWLKPASVSPLLGWFQAVHAILEQVLNKF